MGTAWDYGPLAWAAGRAGAAILIDSRGAVLLAVVAVAAILFFFVVALMLRRLPLVRWGRFRLGWTRPMRDNESRSTKRGG